MMIHEPMTALTDVLVAAVCLWQLRKNRYNILDKGWGAFYFFIGFSTLLGALIHAFLPNHDGMPYIMAWLSMQIVSGLATHFAERITIVTFRLPQRLILISQLKFVIFIVAVIYAQHFSVVLVNNVLGLLPVLFIHLLHPRRTIVQQYIGYGFLIQCFAGLVFALKISPHVDFDHKALAHVVMAVGLVLPPAPPKEG